MKTIFTLTVGLLLISVSVFAGEDFRSDPNCLIELKWKDKSINHPNKCFDITSGLINKKVELSVCEGDTAQFEGSGNITVQSIDGEWIYGKAQGAPGTKRIHAGKAQRVNQSNCAQRQGYFKSTKEARGQIIRTTYDKQMRDHSQVH